VSPRERRRLLRLLGVAAALAALLSLAYALDFQPTWQAAAANFLYTQSNVEQSSRVTIVALDQRSSDAFIGDRPVIIRPRPPFATLIDQLVAAGARVIAFDVLFEVESPDGDPVLARALEQADRVILSVVGDQPRDPPELPGQITYARVSESVAPIVAAAAGVAHANVTTDKDAVVRRLPVFATYQGHQLTALSAAAVARYLRRPIELDGPLQDGHLPLAGRQIPVDPLYQMQISYPSGPDRKGRSAFPVVSMLDVVQGTAEPALFRDRIVFVGPWNQQERDELRTPVGDEYGVEIHANAAEMLLRGTFLTPAPAIVTVGSIAVLALLVGLAVWRLRPLLAGLAALALLVCYVVLAGILFQQGTVLNMLYPPLALVLGFMVLNGYQLVFEQAEQRALRRVLNRYLSPAIAAEVSREPDRVNLGGDLRTMTVLFSDIRGFTTLSERTPPRELVSLLNEYLTAMVDVLFKHGGTLDKYMGDAIMAFWNAPQPQPDHAARACRTALEMVAVLDRLRADWMARGVPALDIGIGLNTGPMIFGNMGSELRTDFTVIGDSVNLGSRLEGLNKDYGTRIVVGESTREAVGDAFAYRFLDLVAVKGKTEPVAIYELLAVAGAVPPAREPVLAAYARGMAAYQARDWPAAGAAFGAALDLDPTDGPSALYLTRTEEYLLAPPPATWDGVYVATHK
jgi:adenylate cyclase